MNKETHEVTWVYPGTFDPVTLGHVDIIQRASRLTHKLIIGVVNQQSKMTCHTQQERIARLSSVLKDFPNIEIVPLDGLIVDFAKAHKVRVIVRGLRSGQDWEFEQQLHGMNKSMHPDIETVFLATDPKFAHISSTIVREIEALGGDISGFVPK